MPNVRMLSISFLFLSLVTYTVLVGDLCLSLSLFSSVFRVMEINDHVSDGLLFNISIPLDFYYIDKEIRALMNLMQTEVLIFKQIFKFLNSELLNILPAKTAIEV